MSLQLLHKLRFLLFSPESKCELMARSLYHRLSATRLYFHLQDKLAQRSLKKFLSLQQTYPDNMALVQQPKVSFILNDTGNHLALEQTIRSVQALIGSKWEIVLLENDSQTLTSLPEAILQDSRIKTINRQHHNLPDVITGDFVLFCQAGDQFFKTLLVQFYHHLIKNPSADVYFYDCLFKKLDNHPQRAFFKPTVPSPAMLLSVNLYSRSIIKLSSIIDLAFVIKTNDALLSQEYDLILHLCENDAKFHHLPAILIKQSALPSPDNDNMIQSITRHLSRLGLEHPTSEKEPFGTRFTWQSGKPSTAIIILSKNHPLLLQSLIDSITKNTQDQKYTITIVDNDSDDEMALAFYQTLAKEDHIQIIPYRQPFNYSQAINLGVNESQSDLILLMNDDMRVVNRHWLSELTQWAVRPEVGVVGAKLIRANRTIQHAGIIMGLTGFVGHIYLNAPEHYFGLWGSADWYRNVIAVTGACQMLRRDLFVQAGGYDESYQLAFGDIVFCLRVHALGYQNIYTPFAQIFHYEGKSRGYVTPVADIQKGYQVFEPYLLKDDPYFSPNLTYTRIPKCELKVQSQQSRFDQIQERKKFYFN